MSLFEFLERLEADPYDPALLAFFSTGSAPMTEPDMDGVDFTGYGQERGRA